MKKTKILFLIHDLAQGGAEKVLVNLVNNMDTKKFDITVMSLFGGGVNEQFLKPHIKYITIFKKAFRGNSKIMKLFSPKTLHKRFIKEKYDIEVSYLEGPSARIISGCNDESTKKACWIHVEQLTEERACSSFKSKNEAILCYNSFHKIACVSKAVEKDFLSLLPVNVPIEIIFNTNETADIKRQALQEVEPGIFFDDEIKLIGVGKLVKNKGFYRLMPLVKKLRDEGYPVHLYLLGNGNMENELRELSKKDGVQDFVTFLGYQTNPYKYVSKCDLFVCSSYSEGFSTAATESLIVSTPVCTTNVSGMEEMLGENNLYGVVTENTDEALYEGIKSLVSDKELLLHYKKMAEERGKIFSTEETVKKTEEFLLGL